MPAELRITQTDWRRVRSDLDRSFRSRDRDERGVIGLVGEIKTERRHVFTITEIIPAEPGDVVAGPQGLIFKGQYVRRAHLRVRERGLAGIATFHTHPFSDERVAFSTFVDDVYDPKLIENLVDLHPGTRLVSVVLGKQSQCGRVWAAPTEREAMTKLTVIGETIEILPLDGSPAPPPPPVSAIFDRASGLTGAGALEHLSNMTIGLVGHSGIGSLMRELLVRAGAGRVIVIDPDRIGDENINRVLDSSLEDAAKKTSKAQLADRATRRTGLATEIVPIDGSVLEDRVLSQLRDADMIIGALDRDWPRQLLCRFAMRYLIPYLDLGTEIGTDRAGTAIISLDARASYVVPGRWCLRCAGYVTPRRLEFESLTPAERRRKIALGYSDDLLLRQPAVMDLNMRAASLGATVLRHLLQPFLLTPLPVAFMEDLVTYSTRRIERPRAPSETCDICQLDPTMGYGDCAPPLGYTAEFLRPIFQSDQNAS